MAVAGWLALGALAGVLMSRLAHHAPADTVLTVVGAMVGALLGGTVVTVALDRTSIGYVFVTAMVVLIGVAAALIRVQEAGRGRGPSR
jgi:uncharacterized protein YejL (UPF0352 family)